MGKECQKHQVILELTTLGNRQQMENLVITCLCYNTQNATYQRECVQALIEKISNRMQFGKQVDNH